MKKYSVKIEKSDFNFLETNYNIKGSRLKRLVADKKGNKAFFKYEGKDYIVSEACSEKMSYEIAKVLGYACAKIELARDKNGNLGILNYLFNDIGEVEYVDAISYLNIYDNQRSNFYTISNIKSILDKLSVKLFSEFVRIMVFDALVGEQDRHEENWGIVKGKNEYKIAPLYDNGCNLLREFKDINFAEQFYCGKKDFNAYIERSKTLIYKDDKKTRYRHFELIRYLNVNYHNIVQNELANLNKLTNKEIEKIVDMIPGELLEKMHKEYIKDYLKKRRNILLDIK